MIVYFADRSLNVLGTASTSLPEGIRILADEKEEQLETGIKTFAVTFAYDDDTRELINNNVAVGNFLLRSATDGNEFYTIVTTEHNTADQTLQAYCEDAGLDLLNTVADKLTNTTSHTLAWYVNNYLPIGWEIGINELDTSSMVLAWEEEATVTERLLSIANNFGGEIGYSYEIERLTVTKRYVNFYMHKGNSTATHQLRLGRDIARITTNKSIEDLATAFIVSGGTAKGSKTPIKLTDGSYSSDGTTTHTPAVNTDPYQIVNKQVRCLPAMEKWSSQLDSDGLLLRQYSYDTTNRKELFSHAVAELRKVVDENVTYDIEFNSFPDDARVGDRIYIIDDKDSLYLEGRILAFNISVTSDTIKATLGEWIIKTSGISDRLAELAREFQNKQLATTVVTLTSSDGQVFTDNLVNTTITVQVTYGDSIITNQTQLDEVFGSASLSWYKNGTAITSTATHVISDNGFTLTLVNENIAALANYMVKVITS